MALHAQSTLGANKVNPRDGLDYSWITPATFRMGCLGPVVAKPNGPSAQVVSLVDTAPTVLDLAGLAAPDLKQSRDRKGAVLVGVPPVRGKARPSQDYFAAEYQGRSMLDGGLAPEPRTALFFTDYSLPLLGLRDGPWKFIYRLDTRRPKLFNLDRDPKEQSDLASA